VKTIALLIIFSAPTQVAGHLPVTVEVKRDVEVSHNAASYESRGKLSLGDAKAKAFRLKKGQRFQMVEIGQEGSCWIRFANKEYRLTSCPWLDGFRDHQTEIFSTVTEK
jgi:streptogramin lyase